MRLQRRMEARGRRRRPWRRWVAVAIALLLLLLLLRDCGPGSGEVAPETPRVEAPAEPAPQEAEAPPAGQIARKDRPEFGVAPPAPLPWLAAFRLQVSARSPRLATCFIGAERPGRLEWTTTVDRAVGVVSDHSLEPMLATQDLRAEERDCVLSVLSEPHYLLVAPEGPATPSRVSVVIEF